jgi:NAD(P) transhydrogenase
VAAGRKSNTAPLNLVAAGLAGDERGLIRVDEHFRTAIPHIYAAGDVIGHPALASTSMQQARLAMTHAFGGFPNPHLSRLLPSGIYTIPEVGTIGETEQALRRQAVDYVPGRWWYRANPRGKIVGDDGGFLKLLFRRADMKLLGVHVIGEQAAELVHIGMIAMSCGAAAETLANYCFNVPTLGELYKTASLDAMARVRTGRSLAEFAA